MNNINAYYNRGFVKQLGDHTVLGLGEIIRYNNRSKIKNENVAEHSFYVVTTVLKICDEYGIDNSTKLAALEFAAVHDIPEGALGDVPFHTKENNPILKEAIEKAEEEVMKTYMPEFSDLYSKFLKEEKEQTLAYLIVKLADVVSVLQYSNREIELGNQSLQMKEINDGAWVRVSSYLGKLEEKISA